MLATKCIGDKFEMLVTDSGCPWLIQYIEKITNITKKVAYIMTLQPTSEISHHYKVTNITMSPTSLSPIISDRSSCLHLGQFWTFNICWKWNKNSLHLSGFKLIKVEYSITIWLQSNWLTPIAWSLTSYEPWVLSYFAISILVGFTVFKFQIISNHNEIFKLNQKSLPLSFSN